MAEVFGADYEDWQKNNSNNPAATPTAPAVSPSTPTKAQLDRQNQIQGTLGKASTELQNTYQSMYDDYRGQTQQKNNQLIGHAQKKASQQAAIMGFNPAVGADYVSRAMSSAYDAAQEANAGLLDRKNELLREQTAKHEQDQREYLDMLKNTNPDLYAKIQSDRLTGVSGADYTGFMNADGSWKTKSTESLALDEEAGQVDYWRQVIADPSASQSLKEAAQRNLDDYDFQNAKMQEEHFNNMTLSAVQQAYSQGKDPFAGKSLNEMKAWAEKNGIGSYSDTDDFAKMYTQGKGSVVLYDGKLYLIEDSNSFKGNDGYKDTRTYEFSLKPLDGGKVQNLSRKKRADSW